MDSGVLLSSRVTVRIYEHRSPFDNPRIGSVEYTVYDVAGRLDETLGRVYLVLPPSWRRNLPVICIECDTRLFTVTFMFPDPSQVSRLIWNQPLALTALSTGRSSSSKSSVGRTGSGATSTTA
jgi:hypothetical protein